MKQPTPTHRTSHSDSYTFQSSTSIPPSPSQTLLANTSSNFHVNYSQTPRERLELNELKKRLEKYFDGMTPFSEILWLEDISIEKLLTIARKYNLVINIRPLK